MYPFLLIYKLWQTKKELRNQRKELSISLDKMILT
nr:MAG TPA: ATPase [Bacteriophage sp.]